MTLPSTAEMYRALVERDQSFEGLFYACVRTTGIFCRPTCHARKPKPENVEYAPTIQEALHRGYRPCQLCEPMSTGTAAPNWLAPLLDEIKRQPDLKLRDHDLRVRGLDPVQVRRTFKRSFGMTFQAYQRAVRLGTAMKSLHAGSATIDAGLDAGFESDSGFRDAFKRLFGVTPTAARGTTPIVATLVPSPLGALLAAATEDGLCMLEFADRKKLPGQAADLTRWFERPVVPGSNPHIEQVIRELEEYFAGKRRDFDVPLDLRGTEFQEAVWRELIRIPFGGTVSYEELALRIGRPGAQRAVGMANGRNRIPIVVPCHRVIQKNGQLRGYGGGLWRKQFLLDLERRTAGLTLALGA